MLRKVISPFIKCPLYFKLIDIGLLDVTSVDLKTNENEGVSGLEETGHTCRSMEMDMGNSHRETLESDQLILDILDEVIASSVNLSLKSTSVNNNPEGNNVALINRCINGYC